MGRVSKRPVDPEVSSRMYEVFRNYLAGVKNAQEVEEFFTSLLSVTEQITLAKRLAIAVLLSKGYTYDQINQVLKVSTSTITSVQRQLMSGASGYKKAVNKILSEENKELLSLNIEEFILGVSLPKSKGSYAWERKSKTGKHIVSRKRKLSDI